MHTEFWWQEAIWTSKHKWEYNIKKLLKESGDILN